MTFTINDYFTNLTERLKDRKVDPAEKREIRAVLGI